MSTIPKVYDYYDPNKFLLDLYKSKKTSNPEFTLNRIAANAGIKSTGHLTDILFGKAKITARLSLPLAAAFNLKKRETTYFVALVNYKLAKKHDKKVACFNRVLELKCPKTNDLDLSQYEYFSKWYYVAIRELLRYYPFKNDYTALARRLFPPVSPGQAKRAVVVLEKIGLIKKNADGWYRQAEMNVTTGTWKSLAVSQFQRDTLDLMKEAFQTVPKEKRSISTVTISISERSMPQIKKAIQMCRAQIMAIASNEQSPDRVYHFAFGAIPMTKSESSVDHE